MRHLILVALLFCSGTVAGMETDLDCLAHNIYFESRNQSVAAQFAVASVTLNRVRSPKYPNTICEVVKQRHQFSWFWDGKSDKPYEKKAYWTAMMVAVIALSEKYSDNTKGALFYHSVKVNPKWAKQKQFLMQIEDHLFYR